MLIGIDASRAFQKNRTGIEEYSYQIIKNLMNKLEGHRVILYIRKNQKVNLKLPSNCELKVIKWPYLWTQIGLSLELLFHPVDILFIPAHTVPIIHPAHNATRYVSMLILWFKKVFLRSYNKDEWHSVAGGPKNTAVVIHGLEYEFCPKAYSFWGRIYMRVAIKNSCRWAKKIIAVSKNTKKDIINLYEVSEDKIKVVYNGVSINNQDTRNDNRNIKYLLFIGRLEERKNILGIVEAFEILKEKYKIPHKLVLAGNPGYGYKNSKFKIKNSKFRNDIVLKGFVSEDEKYSLLKNADVFLFPSFYEGFGLPIIEAQSTGAPVVTSNVSSIPEVVNSSAILVDPSSSQEIAKATYKLISDENFRSDIINRGFKNVKRFSWDKCAEEIANFLEEK